MVTYPHQEPRPLELLHSPPPDLSGRCRRMLAELARLMDVPEQVAAQLAVANTLAHVQAGRSIHVAPLSEPPGDPADDHKRGVCDV